MPDPILRVHNLTKSYGSYLAVDHLSFEIHQGEIMGLLGANGAGKSTTIQMLLGLTDADGGEIEYFGRPFPKERQWCLQQMNFASTYAEMQSRLTVKQNLEVYAHLYDVKNPQQRIRELLQTFEIEHLEKELFWHLSSGQKTRAILVKALLNRPKLILMDEPTASLDPDIVNKFIEQLQELQKKEQLTILYTSHNMNEVARLCNRVAFLVKGKLVALDSPLELTKKIGLTTLQLSFDGDQQLVKTFLEKKKMDFVFSQKNFVEISLTESQIPTVLFDLKKKGVWITEIATEKPSLEDVFLHFSAQQQKDST